MTRFKAEYFPEDVRAGETCLKAVITDVSKQVQTRLEIIVFPKSACKRQAKTALHSNRQCVSR